MLAWRGRGKDELLGALRHTGAASGPAPESGGGADDVMDDDGGVSATRGVLADVTGTPLTASVSGSSAGTASFWSAGLSVARLRSLATAPASPGAPDLLLRMFDPPAVKVRDKDLRDVLSPAYEQLAAAPDEDDATT